MSTRPVDASRQQAGNVPRQIAIIGGGLAGMAAAFRLSERSRQANSALRITLFEAGSRLGGAVATVREDGYLIERGADAFLAKPPILDFCAALGQSDELLPTNQQYRGALVLRAGKPEPVPDGFQLMVPTRLRPILASRILSPSGKARLLAEQFIPRRRDGAEESLKSFVTRRLGRQAFERLVQPLVSGIYTADPEKLSLSATLPRFLEMEQQHGSLLAAGRAIRKKSFRSPDNDMPSDDDQAESSGARYGLFTGPREGMEQILAELREKIMATTTVRLGESVLELGKVARSTGDTPVAAETWMVRTSKDLIPLEFDAVILAVPAFTAAKFLRGVDQPLAELLDGIPYASSAIVATGHKLADIGHPLNAFGLVIPAVENRDILAVSFASRKFPGRAPANCVLLRTFLGGALRPDQLEQSDQDMIATARRELGELLGVRGEPETTLVSRYHRGMPQYHVGHLDRVARIEAAVGAYTGLELTGSAYRGVGIPDVITHANAAVDRLFESVLNPWRESSA